MIPPRQSADFVAHMEDVLEVYKRPLDEKYPVVCMDEQPQQLSRPARGSPAILTAGPGSGTNVRRARGTS